MKCSHCRALRKSNFLHFLQNRSQINYSLCLFGGDKVVNLLVIADFDPMLSILCNGITHLMFRCYKKMLSLLFQCLVSKMYLVQHFKKRGISSCKNSFLVHLLSGFSMCFVPII